ncbi:hypothetical protein SMID22_17470 [Streptococcus mitis]|uniref:hypothetical protein n=1 Tax=Streptococcus mitis TaxID=28037 RepID=UPI00398BF4DA
MTVLEIHNNECFKVAKGILKTNIETPILVKLDSSNGVNYIIFIDGEKLAENLELKVKSSLKKSDLSDKYLLELDFDNPYIQNESLYFEKIIESAVFYEVPESISETKEDLNWFKKVIYEDGYSKEYSREELLKEFGIVEVNPKLGLEFLDLAITSSIEVETVFQRRTTEVEVGRIQQYILPHERGFELPSEFLNYYLIKQFERKQPVQILSTKTTTITKMLSHGYTSNNFIVKILLECILKKVENTIEYQTIIEIVYLIEFNGIFKCLVKAEHLQKILADGSLLGQKEDIELKETSTGLEVKDTDIEHLEQSYSALTINAVPLYY